MNFQINPAVMIYFCEFTLILTHNQNEFKIASSQVATTRYLKKIQKIFDFPHKFVIFFRIPNLKGMYQQPLEPPKTRFHMNT